MYIFSTGSDIDPELARAAGGRHTERVKKQTLRRPKTLVVTVVALAALLTACSSPTPPDVSASEVAPDEAGNFCDAMRIATDAAPLASRSLSALYDEMANEDIYAPGANFEAVSAAGAEVVTRGNAYVDALDQVADFAEPATQDDIDTISDYWTLYAIALGQAAADSADYAAFEPIARPLIESTTTVELRTAQQISADELTSAYAIACSS